MTPEQNNMLLALAALEEEIRQGRVANLVIIHSSPQGAIRGAFPVSSNLIAHSLCQATANMIMASILAPPQGPSASSSILPPHETKQ